MKTDLLTASKLPNASRNEPVTPKNQDLKASSQKGNCFPKKSCILPIAYKLISFIFSIVLAKTLSQHYVGVFLTGFTLMSAISIFIRSGFDQYLIRINAGSADKLSNYYNLSLLTFIPYILSK